MRLLTIIPARAGSKGVPGKNRAVIHGKPLIAWTIECALRTEGLERIVVSTNDSDTLKIASSYDRVVPMFRPEKLAKDTTPIADVISYHLDVESTNGHDTYDAVLLLQVTAPIREPRHILGAIDALKPGINSVISVVGLSEMSPARMYELDEHNVLRPILPAYEAARRQEIPPTYFRNGSIYLVRVPAFRSQYNVMAKPAAGYKMEEKLLLNIDEPRDLLIAGPLIAAWQEGKL
jgi:CMP-N,N'-diacetyllegionaminic acid synthase